AHRQRPGAHAAAASLDRRALALERPALPGRPRRADRSRLRPRRVRAGAALARPAARAQRPARGARLRLAPGLGAGPLPAPGRRHRDLVGSPSIRAGDRGGADVSPPRRPQVRLIASAVALLLAAGLAAVLIERARAHQLAGLIAGAAIDF